VYFFTKTMALTMNAP